MTTGMKKEKKLFIAEEVFLIVRGLKGITFRFADWKRAWQLVRPPDPFNDWNGACDMTLCGALKQQLLNGTIRKIYPGRYVFMEDRARAPFSLKRARRRVGTSK